MEHDINVDLSKHVSEQCGDLIELKACYHNVYNATIVFGEKFHTAEWKIAFGYVKAIDGFLARHAFILDKDNKVIDPTLVKTKHFNDGKDKLYISFKVFETFNDYVNALIENDNHPSMFGDFRNEERQADIWARERDFYLMA